MSLLVVRNGTVVTWGSSCRVLPAHDVLVRDGIVHGILPTRRDTHPGFESARVLDARGKIIAPGFINAHMHFYSTFARGLGAAAPSANFVEVLHNLWWRLDKKLSLDDCRASAEIPLLDAIRQGTTTLIDHHASPGAVDGSLDVIADAVNATGLRASLCYEVSDRDGAAVARAGVAENVRFAKRAHCEGGGHLRAMMGLHASFTLSDETIAHAVDEARKLGLGLHVHTAEADSDQKETEEHYGLRVAERFARLGVLGSRSICAHGVHLSDTELDLLASTDTVLVHNPQSNMNNAVGAANVLDALKRGVLVGLGTDAMTVNMREEVRVALWLQKHRAGHPSVGFVEMLDVLLQGNRRIADRQWKGVGLGELRDGGAADLILLDYDAPTPMSEQNILGHFAFGLAHAPVTTTVVAGRVLMHRGELELPLDEERIRARSRELAAAFWKRF